MEINHDENERSGLELLKSYNHSESLRRHALAVEGTMRALSERFPDANQTNGDWLDSCTILITKNIQTSIVIKRQKSCKPKVTMRR